MVYAAGAPVNKVSSCRDGQTFTQSKESELRRAYSSAQQLAEPDRPVEDFLDACLVYEGVFSSFIRRVSRAAG